ncbi:brachyurin [Culex quinquefasciatus]|uniref:Brachyurin n=1 Tax=Culex quinquefasciatus TaxID=7176 RepID=B0XFN6_CULQU|nr:brachyurin [Culex quinquefasciatus]|eukprot:XP_001868458.1 brachyurin [Culex quinquefasciatus]
MSAALLRCGLVLLLLFCLLVQGQRIAEKKCSEYREKTIQTSMIIPLTLNPRPIRSASLSDVIDRAFYKHPNHKFKSAYNDIALIKLDQNVKFSKIIRPACLWTGSALNVSSVIATGFGLNDTAGDKADILQKVMLDFLDREQCDEKFGSLAKFPRGVVDSQLCIGSKRGGKDTCQGDSGGPVQVITEPKGCTYHVLGLTSTALQGCGIGQSEAIYTRVSSYIDWIERIVWPEQA